MPQYAYRLPSLIPCREQYITWCIEGFVWNVLMVAGCSTPAPAVTAPARLPHLIPPTLLTLRTGDVSTFPPPYTVASPLRVPSILRRNDAVPRFYRFHNADAQRLHAHCAQALHAAYYPRGFPHGLLPRTRTRHAFSGGAAHTAPAAERRWAVCRRFRMVFATCIVHLWIGHHSAAYR